jgi:SAM-dependent methyltransferase
MSESPYLLDNRKEEAGDRFTALAALYDPVTIRHFDTLGVGEGWRCLEVGAGGGSVVRHLSERVGPSGRVLATDLEPRFLEPLAELGNVEIARHDVAGDPLPDVEFDLIHARLVLVHVPERIEVIHRLVQALKPGGWLLIEDGDADLSMPFLDPQTEDEHLANKVRHGLLSLLGGHGVDIAFARKLPRLLREAGLVDIEGDANLPLNDAVRLLERANVLQVQDLLLAQNLVTKEELDRYLARLEDPSFLLAGIFLLAAWGRAPSR